VLRERQIRRRANDDSTSGYSKAVLALRSADEASARSTTLKRNRIDHPPNGGTKDSSDALSGCCWQLSRIPAWMLVDKVPNADYAAALRPALGGQITGIPKRGMGADYMHLLRALRDMPERY
jgi:hypothetical protein